MHIAFPVDSISASHGAPPVSKRDIPTRKAFFCGVIQLTEAADLVLVAAAPFRYQGL